MFVLPWNKSIQLGEHLIDFYPVLKILRCFNVGPFIDHDPAHMRGTVFTYHTVPGFRRAASVHGLKIRCPSDKMNKPFRAGISIVNGLCYGRTFVPSELSTHHFPGGNDLMVILG